MNEMLQKGPDPASSDWYRDPAHLLGELQRSRIAPLSAVPSINGYDHLHQLHRGGQGIVYRAVQRSTRRTVAIKVLLEGAFASPANRRRFEREIELVAELRHPNIVRVYDSGVTPDGHLYFVMEYIEGTSLDKATLDSPPRPRSDSPSRVQDQESRVDTVLQLFATICDAISYAHQHGTIHRDLKPSNIRVDAAGQPHVLDFGLAKTLAGTGIPSGSGTEKSSESGQAVSNPQSAIRNLTVTGQFMGSLPWASPEQAEGRPDRIDVRTDVYALGVMLYQALTGQFPYPVVGSLRSTLNNILTVQPARPSSLATHLDDELDTIVLKCLAKEPERRYQSAVELGRDLRCYLAGEPIEAKRDSAWYTLTGVPPSHRIYLHVLA